MILFQLVLCCDLTDRGLRKENFNVGISVTLTHYYAGQNQWGSPLSSELLKYFLLLTFSFILHLKMNIHGGQMKAKNQDKITIKKS